MDCDACRIAVSARLDGEEWDGDGEALEAHLESCAACRAFEHQARAISPSALQANAVNDATVARKVLDALEPDRSTSTQANALRWLLGGIALAQFVLAIPQLFAAGGGTSPHLMRHEGVFSIALAAGFLDTALRPRRAGALLPVLAVVSVGLIVTAIVDVIAGRAPIIGETTHMLEVVGLVAVWMLVVYERPQRPKAARIDPSDGGVRELRPKQATPSTGRTREQKASG